MLDKFPNLPDLAFVFVGFYFYLLPAPANPPAQGLAPSIATTQLSVETPAPESMLTLPREAGEPDRGLLRLETRELAAAAIELKVLWQDGRGVYALGDQLSMDRAACDVAIAELAAKEPGKPVRIRIDGDVPAGEVKRVYGLCETEKLKPFLPKRGGVE